MKIGLYFGTFNPIHIGHVAIANHMVEYSDLDQIWLVVTPQNPFKSKASLLADYHRLQMVDIALENYDKLASSKIEFELPKPSYTVNTLAYISEKYPQHQFSLIIGEDNLATFHKWKNYQVILENYFLYVYPRISTKKIANQLQNHPKIKKVNAPIMEISSTFIRSSIKDKKNVRALLPYGVWCFLDEMNFYK